MKHLLITFCLSFLILNFSVAQAPKTVTLESNFASEVSAGATFKVSLTITKPDFINYAIFRQQLPKGFSASEIESGTAIFSFSNSFVTYKWLTLPRNEKITLKYKVIANNDTAKTYPVSGVFKYLSGNQQGVVYLNKINIKIMPKGAATKLTKMKSQISENTSTVQENFTNLKCSRTIPALSRKKEFFVELTIQKSAINSTAKISEHIPPGFTARQVQNNGAVFDFKNGVVTFTWDKLPKEQTINVSYKLIPANKQNIKKPVIIGDISYLVSGKITNTKINQEK